jgi:hypothetical protein
MTDTDVQYQPIDTRNDLSYQEFMDSYANRDRPVIIRGGAAGWKSHGVWTPQWFAETIGDLKVPVAVGPRLDLSWKHMTLADYIDHTMHGDTHAYLRQFPIFKHHPELMGYLQRPIYCHPRRHVDAFIWIGSNTVQPLHQDHRLRIDGISNILTQIYGTKRVILASDTQTPYLYRRSWAKTDKHFSEVDVAAPDVERFPLFRHAQLWEGTIHAGDMVFIPSRYWHYLNSHGASISVSFWWRPGVVMDLAARAVALMTKAPRQP